MTFHAPLIIDIAGTALTKADRQRLKHPLVGGLILFARNWQDRVHKFMTNLASLMIYCIPIIEDEFACWHGCLE